MNNNQGGGGGGGGAPSLPHRRSGSSASHKSRAPSHSSHVPDLSHKKDAKTNDHPRKSITQSKTPTGERTVKRLRLSKALTIPEGTTVLDAVRRMATRKVDAALLTDSNALLCGIVTDKDIATRVIGEGLKPAETFVSKIMTKNPQFVLSETSAVDALTKMVQGNFRHLPVVENGEVIALLDIAKCLYDAISRMERAAEKGNAIVAAVEGVEKEWGSTNSVPMTFIETLRERMFRPSIATVVAEHPVVAKVSPNDSVFTAAKKMRELGVNSAVVTVDNKPRGILTPKDILLRVVALFLSPETTLVEKVMTPNPECVNIETPIVDALHVMHDGRFLHLPVVDREGYVVACIDVLQATHAAIATAEIHNMLQVNHMDQVGSPGGEGVSTLMQKFWDSALALDSVEDDNNSEASTKLHSEASDFGKANYPSLGMGNSFGFKLEDRKGRVHRFTCGTESLAELVSAIIQRVGDSIDANNMPQIMYLDDEGDKVLLASDSDLVAAVSYARSAGLKGLKLHLDYSGMSLSMEERETQFTESQSLISSDLGMIQKKRWQSTYTTAVAGAALIAGLSVVAFMKRSTM